MKKLFVFICLLLVGNIVSAQEFADVSRTEYKNDAGLMGSTSKSGFFQTLYPVNYPTGASSWWHLLDVRHTEPSNNHAMQFSGSFFDQNLYFRKTSGSGTTAWSRVLLENSQGLVGIGTTSPIFKLHVSNGIVYTDPGANNGFRAGSYLTMGNMNLGNSPFISFNATLTTSDISAGQNLFTPAYAPGSGLIIKGDAGGSGLHFLQKNYGGNSGQTDLNSFNEVLTLDQAGRLGIGTTPQGKLDVAYAGGTSNFGSAAGGNNFLWTRSSGGSVALYAGGYTGIASTSDICFTPNQTYGSENYNRTAIIKANGNWGITNLEPQAKLDISLLNGSESGLMSTNSTNDVIIARAPFGSNAGSSSNKGAKWGMRFVGRTDGVFNNQKSAAIYAFSEDDLGYNRKVGLSFFTSDFDQNLSERMIISSAGNVGIGTKNAQNYKLAVEGTIGARKVKVTLENTWADYVFAPDYKLLPLQDLETYIKQHQHLPDVPSASEVAANGIDLGDNQTVLLKKIEELTLYMIEQQKSIDKLKAENLLLFKKVEKLEK